MAGRGQARTKRAAPRTTGRAAARPVGGRGRAAAAAAGRVISTEALARVEGEGGLRVRVRGEQVTDVELTVFEPPRFFEAFLRGRGWQEPPDLTARVCGICPVAHQVSAAQAIESLCEAQLSEPLRELRRLLYCGEWIESHALHVYLLHAPDFLGYPGALEMAGDHGAVVERGLRLKRLGNTIMTLIGGRSVNPVNVRVGGFHRLPPRDELRALRPALVEAIDDALETVRLVAGFEFPELEQDCSYVALRPARGYPIENGDVVTSGGATFPPDRFEHYVVEEQVQRSHALHARLHAGGPFAVGPLARYALNHDRLSAPAAQAAAEAGLGEECRNPFRSIVVRAVELVEACVEALRIVDAWDGAASPAVPVEPRVGVGHGVSEAPRGLLYHRYELGPDGLILDARLVPPTAQNQGMMEADVRAVAQAGLHLPEEELQLLCEHAIRNYDPCISCATHFLDLRVDRG